jgi:hypothetical protein
MLDARFWALLGPSLPFVAGTLAAAFSFYTGPAFRSA